MRPFGCLVTILNTLDPLGKFDRKANEGFLVEYSINIKAFRVFNTRTRKVEENLHITFLENKPNVVGSGPDWLIDIDLLTNSMNYEPFTTGNQTNRNAVDAVADDVGKKTTKEPANEGERNGQEKEGGASNKEVSNVSPSVSAASGAYNDEDVGAEADLNNLETTMNRLVDLPKGKHAIRTKWVYRSKKDERGIVVRNKARLVVQSYTQEEGIDYDEVFAPIARIEAIRLFLAYASFMGFIMYQMDVNNDFLYGTIEAEVYVYQPPSFEDPQFLNKVYKVEKALYGLHQAPRAWYKTLSTYLLENGFRRGTIDKTLFIKKDKDNAQEILDEFYGGAYFLFKVAASRSDIMFVVCACARFQVTPKVSHLYAMKRIFRYLKGQPKLGLWYPRDSPFDLEHFLTVIMLELALTGNPQQKVLCIQNQMLDYGFNFMNTKIQIDNESSIFNDVKQIHTTVDGKIVVISESSVRSDLYFNDEDVICLANGQKFNFSKLIFDGMLRNLDTNTKKFLMHPRNGKDILGRITSLFASMLAPPVVEGEGSGQPTEPQPVPSTSQLIIEEQIPTSVPIQNVADEAVFKEWDDRVVRATTTAASLDATHASGDRPRCQEAIGGVIAQTKFERTSKHSYDLPLPRVNTPGSDEERIEHQELTDNIPPTPHDSPLSEGYTPGSDEEKEKDAQAMEILKLKNRIKKLERKAKSSIPPPKRRLYKQVDSFDDISGGTEVFDDTTAAKKDVNAADPISTAGDAVSAASVIPDIDTARPSNVSAAGLCTSTAGDIFEDEMMTIADTLVAIRSIRSRTILVVIHDVEEEPRRATPVPIVQSQDKGKSKIVEPGPTLKNPIKAQIQRDAEIARRLFEEDQAQFEREQRIARERAAKQEAKEAALIEQIEDVNSFIPMYSKVVKDSGKKDDSSSKQAGSSKKRAGLKLKLKSPKKLKVMKEQESAVDDAKKEEVRACLDIVPGDDIVINVESLTTKYLIIRCARSIQVGKGKEDEVWNGQQDYKLISYRLFDSCVVHVLLMDIGVAIHMMVETKYPLTQEMLSWMLNRRLEVDHESTMAFELIRFIKLSWIYPTQLSFNKLSKICSKGINSVHDTFHMSNLKKCLADQTLQIPLDEMKVDARLNFVEEPMEILEREFKKLKRSRIAIVKVRWNSKRGPEFTWEREDQIKLKYPHL
ncbi:retrovirus-related pol polyprotein from transposon TNT 1-94 [Tanacetum coccineum]